MDDEAVGQPPSPFTAQSVYPADTGATNPELAAKFLLQHRGSMAAREPEIDNVLSRMQLNTDSMTKMLDDTTATIKASREGRTNLPLLALASGLMGPGNFGDQLGAGLARMVPTIAADRREETDVNLQLAQLGLRRAGLENVPLQAKLAYAKAMQTGDQNAVRGIEQALIRSQAQLSVNGNTKEQQLLQKTLQQAEEEARKSVAQESTEMYATDNERRKAMRERFIQKLEIRRAAGLNIPQKAIDQVLKTMQDDPGTTGVRKSFYDAPTSPEAKEETIKAGLPAPPTGYIYETVGPKERPKIMQEQTTAFNKEMKDWDETSKVQRDTLTNIERAEKILERNPKVVGRQYGLIPGNNSWLSPNLSEDAQTVNGIFQGMQVHNVPKGQGAVSNLERELFANAGPNMGVDVATNKNLMNIQKEIIKRDTDRRAFFSEYFSKYRTMDGMVSSWERYINDPAGQSFKYDGSKGPVPNTERMSWREYFRKERGEPQARRDGGYIKLGAEYD